jgi:hypothetical protein
MTQYISSKELSESLKRRTEEIEAGAQLSDGKVL